ncbi:MAG: hypothetical protein HC877_15070 [Thioploca sp.]|nr:hypothetical protein [Thioploca sp.]
MKFLLETIKVIIVLDLTHLLKCIVMNIVKQRLIDLIHQQPDDVSAETLLQMVSATLIQLQPSSHKQLLNIPESKQLA